MLQNPCHVKGEADISINVDVYTGEGNGNTLQYSCLENPMDGGAWWAEVHGVAKSWTRLKRLSSSSILYWWVFLICFLKVFSTWEFVSLFNFGNLRALSLALFQHLSSLCAVFLEFLIDTCRSFLYYLSQQSHLSFFFYYCYWFNLWYFLIFIFQFLQFL